MRLSYVFMTTATCPLTVFSLLTLWGMCNMNVANAQFRVGPTVGINVATLQMSRQVKEDYGDNTKVLPILRLHIGAIGEYQLSDLIILRSGIILNRKGAQDSYDASQYADIKYKETIRLNYLEIPLTARYQLAENDLFSLSGLGGFILGFTTRASAKHSYEFEGQKETDTETWSIGKGAGDQIRGNDVSLQLGAVAELSTLPLQVSTSFNQGLNNIISQPDSGYAMRNFTFAITATYLFDLE